MCIRDRSPVADSVFTDLYQLCVQFGYPILEIKVSQADRIGCECRSIYDLASGIHIGTLQFL